MTETLLPPEVLLDVLHEVSPDGVEPVTPVDWYYRTLDVFPMSIDDTLVYSIQIPLVSSITWCYLQIVVWAYPVGNHYSIIQLPTSLLHDTNTNKIVDEPNCVGMSPVVCTAHVYT